MDRLITMTIFILFIGAYTSFAKGEEFSVLDVVVEERTQSTEIDRGPASVEADQDVQLNLQEVNVEGTPMVIPQGYYRSLSREIGQTLVE